jgi:hypothetical protein
MMLLVLRGDTSDLFLLAGANQSKRELLLIGVNQQLVGHRQRLGLGRCRGVASPACNPGSTGTGAHTREAMAATIEAGKGMARPAMACGS